jgi:hypothetical protein
MRLKYVGHVVYMSEMEGSSGKLKAKTSIGRK